MTGESERANEEHWNRVYATKAVDAVSWYAAHLESSLRLIRESASDRDARIIDVGGGASTLVDDLLADGYRAVSVLDLADEALRAARERLGERANEVTWITGDVTRVTLPERSVDVWHDRAVFHFLTDPADRARYVANVARSVRPRGARHRRDLRTAGARALQRAGGRSLRRGPAARHLRRPLHQARELRRDARGALGRRAAVRLLPLRPLTEPVIGRRPRD